MTFLKSKEIKDTWSGCGCRRDLYRLGGYADAFPTFERHVAEAKAFVSLQIGRPQDKQLG